MNRASSCRAEPSHHQRTPTSALLRRTSTRRSRRSSSPSPSPSAGLHTQHPACCSAHVSAPATGIVHCLLPIGSDASAAVWSGISASDADARVPTAVQHAARGTASIWHATRRAAAVPRSVPGLPPATAYGSTWLLRQPTPRHALLPSTRHVTRIH